MSGNPSELLVGTYNMWEHGMYPHRSGEDTRYELQAQIMRDEFPNHIWLVQEIGNVEAFERLAKRLGMECAASTADQPSEPVFDPGGRGFGVGVMWDPQAWGPNHGINPVPGTRRVFTKDVFFHGVAYVVLDLGNELFMQFASGHATPWGFPQNLTEAKRWVSIMRRPNRGLPGDLAQKVLPGVLGTDSNAVTGDQLQQSDGTWRHHAPDPLENQTWFDDMIYQLPQPRELNSKTGKPVPKVDRIAGDVIWDGGLYDPSATLNLPFTPTTGYHDVDPFPDRDLDHLRITKEHISAVTRVEVLDNERVRKASDHRPKRIRIDLTKLRDLERARYAAE